MGNKVCIDIWLSSEYGFHLKRPSRSFQILLFSFTLEGKGQTQREGIIIEPKLERYLHSIKISIKFPVSYNMYFADFVHSSVQLSICLLSCP